MWDPTNPNSVWRGPFGTITMFLSIILAIALVITTIYFASIGLGLFGEIIYDKYDINTGCPFSNPNCTVWETRVNMCFKNNNDALYGGCSAVGIIMLLILGAIAFILLVVFVVLSSCYNSYKVAGKLVEIERKTQAVTSQFPTVNDAEMVELE